MYKKLHYFILIIILHNFEATSQLFKKLIKQMKLIDT